MPHRTDQPDTWHSRQTAEHAEAKRRILAQAAAEHGRPDPAARPGRGRR